MHFTSSPHTTHNQLTNMPGKVLQDACVDCQSVEASLAIRNRRLCRDCFIKYVNAKILKRMESYRFKNNNDDTRRKLLLPVSGGISSLVLLQVLESQLQRQRSKRTRTAYELLVLLVDRDLGIDDTLRTRRVTWYQSLQARFPSLSFASVQSLSNVLAFDRVIEDDMKVFGLARLHDESDLDFTRRIVASAASPTASADLEEILLNRLIVSWAKQHDCESILWGHSDSRLAAKALAGVAKGRGGSLPFQISDGPSTAGINFNYPLRDLFQPELSLYASSLPEVFSELVIEDDAIPREKVSMRNTSIDDLLTTYINSQGEKYPSIMANVVRTASKLRTTESNEATKNCRICLVQYQADPGELAGETHLCYACSRTRHDIRKIGN
jgi:cytoplasmic tRNA 2-thiolation protein 2